MDIQHKVVADKHYSKDHWHTYPRQIPPPPSLPPIYMTSLVSELLWMIATLCGVLSEETAPIVRNMITSGHPKYGNVLHILQIASNVQGDLITGSAPSLGH